MVSEQRSESSSLRTVVSRMPSSGSMLFIRLGRRGAFLRLDLRFTNDLRVSGVLPRFLLALFTIELRLLACGDRDLGWRRTLGTSLRLGGGLVLGSMIPGKERNDDFRCGTTGALTWPAASSFCTSRQVRRRGIFGVPIPALTDSDAASFGGEGIPKPGLLFGARGEAVKLDKSGNSLSQRESRLLFSALEHVGAV